MKTKVNSVLLAITCLIAAPAIAQNTFPSSGNVGIGTLSPASSLQVIGSSRFGTAANYLQVDATGNLSLVGTSVYKVGGNKYAFQYSGNGNYGLFFNSTNVRYEFRNSAAAATFFVGADNGNGYFLGTLGIGTTTAHSALQFGNVIANRRIVMWEDANNDNQFYGFGINGNTLRYQTANTSADHVFFAGTSTSASSELMRIKGNGNVGIGTSTPPDRLSVEGALNVNSTDGSFRVHPFFGFGYNTTLLASFHGTTASPQIRFDGNAAGFIDIGQDGTGNFTVETNDAPRLTVTQAGNVGIGTAAPATTLEVVGSTKFSGGYSNICTSADNTQGNVAMGFTGAAGNAKLYVLSNQDYGAYIDDAAAAQFALYVNGTAAKPGGSSWTVASDERLKNNVEQYKDGLAQIMQIKPVKFHYNTESGFDTKKEYVGVVAQQLQQVAPYMVGKFNRFTDKKEYLNVDNSAMTYMLINAVKELKGGADVKDAKIEELQTKVDKQQQQINAILQKLNELQTAQLACCNNAGVVSSSASSQLVMLNDAAGLEQNTPNPFSASTIIRYTLPQKFTNAHIVVIDNTGKTMKQVTVTGTGKGSLNITAGSLASGTYKYSLLVDGKVVSTKTMVLTK